MTKTAAPSGIFPPRKTPHTIILARGETVRHWTVRPWMLGAAFGGMATLVAASIASTALFLMSDDVASAFRAREARTITAYEQRVATLRQQIDHLSSRQHAERRMVADQVETLITRQQEIAARYEILEPLLDEAREAGITATVDVPLPSPRAGTTAAFAPDAPSATKDIFQGFDLRAQSIPSSERLASDILPSLRSSMDSLETRQSLQAEQIAEAAQTRSGKLGRTLASLGFDTAQEPTGVGGPFIPAMEDEAEDPVHRLSAALGELRRMRTIADAAPLVTPVSAARVSSSFGTRRDPFLGRRALHAGIDYPVVTGTPVVSAAAGTVLRAGRAGAYGLLVEIDHGNGHMTRYAHLSRVEVAAGQEIAASERVGLSGSTGRSTGPHLHYEIHVDGTAVDPAPYVRAGRSLRDIL